MTIQEALNEAAKNQGYKNWNEVENKPVYGGSSIRAIACKSMELYAEAKAKEFAEWILVEGFEKYQDNGDCWWGKFNEEKDYSTEQLYEKFKTQ